SRVQHDQPVTLARQGYRRSLLKLHPERPRQPPPDLDRSHAAQGEHPVGERGRVVEHAGVRREPQGADHAGRIKILQSGDLHPSYREKVETTKRSGKPEPEREAQNEAAEDLPAGLQAAPSHCTSSGPTRVMSPAPRVSTTSPGSRASYTRRPTSGRCGSDHASAPA